MHFILSHSLLSATYLKWFWCISSIGIYIHWFDVSYTAWSLDCYFRNLAGSHSIFFPGINFTPFLTETSLGISRDFQDFQEFSDLYKNSRHSGWFFIKGALVGLEKNTDTHMTFVIQQFEENDVPEFPAPSPICYISEIVLICFLYRYWCTLVWWISCIRSVDYYFCILASSSPVFSSSHQF